MDDKDLFDILRQTSIETIATHLFKRGFRQQFLVGLSPMALGKPQFVGRAFTMRYIPAREDLDTLESLSSGDNLQWAAFEGVGAGEVLVIDSFNSIEAASGGDMLVSAAMRRGAAAVITDGAFRDGTAIGALPMPSYARARTATTRLSRFHVADLQVPIGCAGVAVYPGDVIVGSDDGVVVIPSHVAPELAEPALEQERLEAYLHTRVADGTPLKGIYPPNQHTIDEYHSYRESGGVSSGTNG